MRLMVSSLVFCHETFSEFEIALADLYTEKPLDGSLMVKVSEFSWFASIKLEPPMIPYG